MKNSRYWSSKSELARWCGLMHLGRVMDEKAPNYLKQAMGWS